MIVLKNVTKHFEGGLIKALNGVSLEVERGGIVSIMGPSGCGKSTLLSLIGGLDVPTGGEIWFGEKRLTNHNRTNVFRARTIGFVFQFHHLIPNLTLLENVELPMFSFPGSKKARREKAAGLLLQMGLEERMHSLPTRVSGGERQRAAIARAMINDPEVLLADEPTGSVDTETGNRILDLLIVRCVEKKMTMILATHNLEIAAKTSRIIRMKNGRLEDD
jgi:ABC-type lipoprotein export system ATPase subunit